MVKKDRLKIGATAAAFLAFFGILCAIHIPVKKSTAKAFAQNIQNVLDQNGLADYRVQEQLLLKNPGQVSLSVFKLAGTKASAPSYACLMRITGICGPVPVVFVYEYADVRYVGIAGFKDTIYTKENCGISDIQIAYWSSRIRFVMEDMLK